MPTLETMVNLGENSRFLTGVTDTSTHSLSLLSINSANSKSVL